MRDRVPLAILGAAKPVSSCLALLLCVSLEWFRPTDSLSPWRSCLTWWTLLKDHPKSKKNSRPGKMLTNYAHPGFKNLPSQEWRSGGFFWALVWFWELWTQPAFPKIGQKIAKSARTLFSKNFKRCTESVWACVQMWIDGNTMKLSNHGAHCNWTFQKLLWEICIFS